MFVMVVATLCYLMQPGSVEQCKEVVVADTDHSPDLTWFGCLNSQGALADWKANSKFSDPKFRIKGYKCVPDRSYVLKSDA